MLPMILKQSPWLMDARCIAEDVHLIRLKAFTLIHHDESFLNYSFRDGVYIVTGQIGKSTHLKMLVSKLLNKNNHTCFLYFNCDLLNSKQEIVALVETYLEEFRPKERCYLLLDEITLGKRCLFSDQVFSRQRL